MKQSATAARHQCLARGFANEELPKRNHLSVAGRIFVVKVPAVPVQELAARISIRSFNSAANFL
jgi:hypothetical protein